MFQKIAYRPLFMFFSAIVMLMISACGSEDEDERMDAEKPQEEVLVEQPNLDPQLQKERESVMMQLGKGEMRAREETIDALVAIAVPKLIEGLSDKERVRFAASDALVAVGEPAVPALIRQLRVDDAEMCRQVVFVLGQIGEGARAAIPDLIDLLLNEPDLRPAVASALGRIGDEAAVPALIQILENGDARLHSNVIGTLGAIGPPTKPPVPLLIEIVDAERHWHVRCEAVIALGQIGAPAAIPVLIQSLVGKLLFSVEFELPPILKKPVMPAALQQEFEKHGISPFGIAMLTPGKMWLTKDKERAYLIIKEEDLLNAYEDMGQEVRSGAAHALAQIGEPAILALIEVLNHPNTVAGVQASAALRKIGTPEVIKAADEFWENLGKR